MSYDRVHGEPDDDEIPVEAVGRAMIHLRDSTGFRNHLRDHLDIVLDRWLDTGHQLTDEQFEEVLDHAVEGVVNQLAKVRDENVEAHPFGIEEGMRFMNHRATETMTGEAIITDVTKYGTRLSYHQVDDRSAPPVAVPTGRFVEDPSFEIIDEDGDDENGGDDDRLTLG